MSEAPDEKIVIAGIELRCAHCRGDLFMQRSALLNTPMMTLLGFDWANKTATIYICSRCGYLHWFESDIAEHFDDRATECLSCGEDIPSGTDRCGACGWSYRDDMPDPEPDTVGYADDTATECLSCGGEIPPGVDRCSSCGWSYRDIPKDE